MFQETLFDRYSVCCQIIPMGKDYTLAVYGGDTPHVGSVVMAVARPSLTGEGVSATSSVINGIGHKDEEVGRIFAETVAKAKLCTVVCSCGIHVDNIGSEQIAAVMESCKRLLKRVMDSIQE